MHFWTIILILGIIFYIKADDLMTDIVIARRNKCADKLKFDVTLLNKTDFESLMRAKCTVACLGRSMGVINEDGTINIPGAITMFSERLNKTGALKIIHSCLKVYKEEYGCAKGYQTMRCVYNEIKKVSKKRGMF